MNELLYMDYMTESDRESFIKEKTFMDEFEKLNILFEMCNLQLKIHNIDVENKVLTESGTYDDYALLLMEANQQVTEQKQGIIAKIFEWFANLFSNIHKAIVGLFDSFKDPNKDVQVNAAYTDPQFISMLDEVVGAVKKHVIPIIGSAVFSALVAIFKDKIDVIINKFATWLDGKLKSSGLVKVKASVANTITGKLNDAQAFFSDLINKIKNKKAGDDNETNNEQGFLKSIGNIVSKFINKPIMDIVKGGNTQAPANNQQPGQAPTQNQQAAQPAQQAAPQNPQPAAPAQPQQPAQPVQASAPTEEIQDGELSMYESVFGKVEESEEQKDDISDLLSMI